MTIPNPPCQWHQFADTFCGNPSVRVTRAGRYCEVHALESDLNLEKERDQLLARCNALTLELAHLHVSVEAHRQQAARACELLKRAGKAIVVLEAELLELPDEEDRGLLVEIGAFLAGVKG